MGVERGKREPVVVCVRKPLLIVCPSSSPPHLRLYLPFNSPKQPDQWYRFYLPLFIHIGVVQLFFVLLMQHSIAVDIERVWERTKRRRRREGGNEGWVAEEYGRGMFGPDDPHSSSFPVRL